MAVLSRRFCDDYSGLGDAIWAAEWLDLRAQYYAVGLCATPDPKRRWRRQAAWKQSIAACPGRSGVGEPFELTCFFLDRIVAQALKKFDVRAKVVEIRSG